MWQNSTHLFKITLLLQFFQLYLIIKIKCPHFWHHHFSCKSWLTQIFEIINSNKSLCTQKWRNNTLERAYLDRASPCLTPLPTSMHLEDYAKITEGSWNGRTRKENTCRQHDKYVSRWRCIECIKYEEFFFFPLPSFLSFSSTHLARTMFLLLKLRSFSRIAHVFYTRCQRKYYETTF